MHRLMALSAAALLLAGCNSEPDFDERYADAEKRIQDKAAAMDRDLSRAAVEESSSERTGPDQAGS